MQFKGTVINMSDVLIEVKKESREMTLYWTDQSKVLYQGKEAGRSAVEICQKVRANYTVKDHRYNLVSLEILQESYCTK
ncbi:MAG: hypothetical protein A2176_02015 [Spirochaetes bacterium RBG_13_51_14]|nr:MAG: hypothetical protein A2176_02015 [Spirochaetes bacterium RBG_13_51_14]